MRNLAFFVPFAVAATLAGAAAAQPAVTVTLAPELQRDVRDLGQREIQEQVDRLAAVVSRAVADTPALAGARIDLVLTDLKPNRPTFQQTAESPGLDPIRSLSIGGAEIEGAITLADGTEQPVRYRWFSHNITDVRGFAVWQDAERAYQRLGANLAAGRYVGR
ncbi:hypothetical protein [Brevundimonas sp. FT23042]|uniref:hypothetical protein n=1 Tax=Brevundimonas sp. FT23042 TaxID=3393749 RepID=UPI003B58939F